MSALRALVKNSVKESFDITFMGNEKRIKLKKKKVINVLTTFFISHKTLL